MKRILSLFVALTAVFTLQAQGIKKANTPKTAPVKQEQVAKQDTAKPVMQDFVLKGFYTTDTVKIAVIAYVEDGSFQWVKGYAVVNSFVVNGTQPQKLNEVYFTHKWEAVKPEDIYDIKQMNWK